jgi:dihydropyrimidine dehydrogenase (NAD+) subunit PreA
MKKIREDVDISIDFCGLEFENPFMLSSAPPTATGEMIRRAFDAGWGGAVSKTIGLEPTANVRPRFAKLQFEEKGMIGFENIELITDRPLEYWLPELERTKRDYPDKILIASIMAEMDPSRWQKLAKKVQETGIDAIELNVSCPHGMPEKGMGSAIGQDPKLTGDVVKWVKEVADVPVIAKLTPNVTDITLIARAAKENGADALSGINTVLGFMGVNLETLEPKPSVGGMSAFGGCCGPAVKPIGLRCVAQMAKSTQLPISGVGGISTWRDAVEFMMVGASTVQLCTAVMFRGYKIVSGLKSGLANYLREKGFGSVEEIVGYILPRISTVESLDFDLNVVYEVDKEKCIRCGLCYVACRDAGYQAITLDKNGLAAIDEEKCDGCSLCSHVCPVWDCIRIKSMGKLKEPRIYRYQPS